MTRWIITCVAIGAVALAGCGGGDDSPPEALDELEAAVREYTEDFSVDEYDDAYSMWSARCQELVARDDIVGQLELQSDVYGTYEVTSFDADVDGSSAAVSYSISERELSQSEQAWVLEDGAWRYDACDALS